MVLLRSFVAFRFLISKYRAESLLFGCLGLETVQINGVYIIFLLERLAVDDVDEEWVGCISVVFRLRYQLWMDKYIFLTLYQKLPFHTRPLLQLFFVLGK